MSAGAAVFGVVIAGGRSSRMGGGSKALLALRGQPLIAHVVARLRPQCSGLAVSVNDPASFAELGLPLLADPAGLEFAGPLAGVLAGLDHIAAQHGDMQWMITAPADVPFLPSDLVTKLIAARTAQNTDIACTASGGRVHPVIALWPVRVRDALRGALTTDAIRRVDRFTARYRVAVVEWPALPRDPFFNINERDDLVMAEAMADG